jgi:hypothetical protein
MGFDPSDYKYTKIDDRWEHWFEDDAVFERGGYYLKVRQMPLTDIWYVSQYRMSDGTFIENKQYDTVEGALAQIPNLPEGYEI